MNLPLKRLGVCLPIVALASCGGSGNSALFPDGGSRGTLAVQISAPSSGTPSVTVTGPGAYSVTLDASAQLAVAPGAYDVVAQELFLLADSIVGGSEYSPTVTGS